MQSGLERFIINKISSLLIAARHRDRAVLFGALLSFSPIFPACFLGVIFSFINLLLIRKQITNHTELNLVKISLIVGVIFCSLWIMAFAILGDGLTNFLKNLLLLPASFFKFLFLHHLKDLWVAL